MSSERDKLRRGSLRRGPPGLGARHNRAATGRAGQVAPDNAPLETSRDDRDHLPTAATRDIADLAPYRPTAEMDFTQAATWKLQQLEKSTVELKPSSLSFQPLVPPNNNDADNDAAASDRYYEQLTAEFRGLDAAITRQVSHPLGSDTSGSGRVGTESREFPRLDHMEHGLRVSIEHGAPAHESHRDRTRRRISALLERGRQMDESGEREAAVLALEMAFAEDPDSAAAHKLLSLGEQANTRIFENYLGDLGRAPRLGIAPEQLMYEHINAHAAFVLSRVDGMLSIEELLDVAGMSRIEALRYLSSLLLRGILILPS